MVPLSQGEEASASGMVDTSLCNSEVLKDPMEKVAHLQEKEATDIL